MRLDYSAAFTVTTTEVLIKKATTGDTEGNNIIPAGVSVRAITIFPTKSGGSYPLYHVKGINALSEWVKIETDIPVFSMDGLLDIGEYMYVRSDSGSITMNLIVKGQP